MPGHLNMSALVPFVFFLGYLAIAFEHRIRINKAAAALLTGILCWSLYAAGSHAHASASADILHHLGGIAGILFFLVGAMAIVEVMDAHGGFTVITDAIRTVSRRKLLWIIGLLCFFMSAVLDNLTTTIVMVSFITKMARDRNDQLMLAGLVVIAANAGGAWSPIGDVTTTMLWIGGRISTAHIIRQTFLPSFLCLLVPLLWMTLIMKGALERPPCDETAPGNAECHPVRRPILYLGVGLLLFVPIFKTLTGLPPFMGMLLSLSVFWVVTEILHRKEQGGAGALSVSAALGRIDLSSVLFFLGILLAVAALEAQGFIGSLATIVEYKIRSGNLFVLILGFLSAVVDNVPLVSSAMGMYHTSYYPLDHSFWVFLAYCTGTGGSLLVIGSAAGIAAMGMLKIDFFWYLRKIAPLALGGYLAGAAVYFL